MVVDGVSVSTQNPPAWMVNLFSLGAETTSGVEVSERSARGYSLFSAGMDAICRPLATVPLVVYRRLERGREKAERHWLYPILRTSPNPDMSSIDWRERALADMLLGNSYNAITFDARGTVARIDPLPPDLVTIKLTPTGDLLYERTDTHRVYRPDEMLHFRGPGSGVKGESTVSRHAQALGTLMASERFAGSYFGNGATLSGVLQHPGQLGKAAQERLKEGFMKVIGNKGGSGAHKVAVLEEAMEWKPTGVDPEKSQLLETRKHNVRDMARILGIPPHRLMDLEDAHFDNIESQNVEFWQALLYFAEKIEQEIDRKLLSGGREYYCKHDLRVMLRADTEKRNEAYAKGRQWGYLSANDIREHEDLNPIEGGDEYLAPMNMVPVSMLREFVESQIAAKTAPAAPEQMPEQMPAVEQVNSLPSVAEVRERAREAFLPLFREAAERIVRRETGEVAKAARRLLAKSGEFRAWLDDFWTHQREFCERAISAAIESYGMMAGIDTPHPLAVAHTIVDGARAQVEKVATDAAALERLLAEWEANRAETIARLCLGDTQ